MGSRYSYKRLCLYIALGLSLLLVGCASGNFGRFSRSKFLMDGYHDKTLPEGYNYYYTGNGFRPRAVVGIDPSYTLDTQAWILIRSRDDLYRKIQKLSKIEEIHSFMNVENILSPSGRIIGAWFSYYEPVGVRVDEKAHRLRVSAPFKEILRRRRGRSIFGDD